MGEALFDLEQVLISKKEKLTPREASILLSLKSNAVTGFTASALAGGAAVWAATWKLRTAWRINLSAVAGGSLGLWVFARSLYSCVDQILTLDGSILQKELANIMVTKYQNDPLLMKLISKHFYSEKIFDDSTSNTSKLRWRYRNFYSDNVVHGHRTHDHGSIDKSQGDTHNDSYDKSQGNSHDDSYDKSQDKSENVTDSRRTTLGTKQFFKDMDYVRGNLWPLFALAISNVFRVNLVLISCRRQTLLIVFLVMVVQWRRSIILIPRTNHQERIIGAIEDFTVGVGCEIMMTFQTHSMQQLFDCHPTFAEVDVLGLCKFFAFVFWATFKSDPFLKTVLRKGRVFLVC